LHAADRERAPIAILGQGIDHGQQVSHVGRNAIGDAHAQLNERWGAEEAFLDHLLDEPQIAGIEDFQFRLDAEVLADAGALPQVIGRRHVGAIAVAEIQAAAVQGRDVGPVQTLMAEVDDVAHPILLADEIAARSGRVLEPMISDDDVAAHAARKVHDHIDLALPDALDDLPVVPCFHAERTRFGLTNVNMDDGRARLGRRNGGGGDFRRCDGAMRALGDLGVIPGDRARNDDVVIHNSPYAHGYGQRTRFIIFIIIFKRTQGNIFEAAAAALGSADQTPLDGKD
jgi:hypothetical protein